MAMPSALSMAETAFQHYNKYLATMASVAGSAMLAKGFLRELLPGEAWRLLAAAYEKIRLRFFRSVSVGRHTIVVQEDDDDSRGHSGCYGDDDSDEDREESKQRAVRSLFEAVETYLAVTMKTEAVSNLKAAVSGRRSNRIWMSLQPEQEVVEEHGGGVFTWKLVRQDDEKRGRALWYELSFPDSVESKRHAVDVYLPHVLATANAVLHTRRQLKIHRSTSYGSWSSMIHSHPSTFDTLAMEPELKKKIIADLDRFVQRRAYYRRIGKAWKRGYLLYGPPGTGKSSLVAAMANHLRYDIYALDLAAVHSNERLLSYLLGMGNKSILVVEDIDCSCGFTGPRKGADSSDSDDEKGSPVTLSGLLNVVDGLWSASGEERLIVFTTNYVDRLDPALLRPGRMDMHIYMGYCGWEAFKTLAANYFVISEHPLFPAVEQLLKDGAEVTPAEVAEMMLRSEDADVALQGVVELLQEKLNGVVAGDLTGVGDRSNAVC